MAQNGTKSLKNVDQIVDSFMGKFQGVLKGLVVEAVNDGARQGGEEVRKRIAAQLSMSTGLVSANDTPKKKRDKTAKGNVKCPAPNCKHPGVRPLNCFCREHFEKLPAEKRLELRAAQLEAKKKAAA